MILTDVTFISKWAAYMICLYWSCRNVKPDCATLKNCAGLFVFYSICFHMNLTSQLHGNSVAVAVRSIFALLHATVMTYSWAIMRHCPLTYCPPLQHLQPTEVLCGRLGQSVLVQESDVSGRQGLLGGPPDVLFTVWSGPRPPTHHSYHVNNTCYHFHTLSASFVYPSHHLTLFKKEHKGTLQD